MSEKLSLEERARRLGLRMNAPIMPSQLAAILTDFRAVQRETMEELMPLIQHLGQLLYDDAGQPVDGWEAEAEQLEGDWQDILRYARLGSFNLDPSDSEEG